MKTLNELQQLIIVDWATPKGLIKPENAPMETLKLIEECGELARAIINNDQKEQKDAIGDIFVVLVILSKQLGIESCFKFSINKTKVPINQLAENIDKLITCSFDKEYHDACISCLDIISNTLNLDITECANLAWNEIKDRKGVAVNGTFIKN